MTICTSSSKISKKGELFSEKKNNPYQEYPVYETKNFIFRLIKESDAEDLLECYSDPESEKIFNSDNCLNKFIFKTSEEVSECIRFWLKEYEKQYYVRFSIVEKRKNKSIGTIEIFVKKKHMILVEFVT